MLFVNSRVSIPVSEFSFSASRSGKPGGQNVNKVNSKITLYFDYNASHYLNSREKRLIKARLKNRVNSENQLVIQCQENRTQNKNREGALSILADLLANALKVEKKRVKTRVPAGAKQKRLDNKKARGALKAQRRANWD
jgi:ribosome-associated protein